MDRTTKTIVIVAASTTDAATTRTRDAIISAGYASGNITLAAHSGTIPAADIIVIVRGIGTQALYDTKIAPAFEAGTPVIFGSADGVSGDSAIAATRAKLTGNWFVAGTNLASLTVHNNDHPITAGESLGDQAFYTANNWSYFLPTGDALYSQALLRQLVDVRGDLIPLEAGHIDLLGNPTAARCVLFGNVYGRQSAYTQLGIDLIGNAIEWALSGGSVSPPVLSLPSASSITANSIIPNVTLTF